MAIDWDIVTKIAGLGFLVLLIVVGFLSLVIWLVNLLVRRIITKNIPAPVSNGETKGT